jgi:GNAT superfamily N-acetyltransferase
MPSAEVLDWWDVPDVEPWVTVEPDDQLIAYGELWTDEEEDEVELARLIVAPELRGRGLANSSCGVSPRRLLRPGSHDDAAGRARQRPGDPLLPGVRLLAARR